MLIPDRVTVHRLGGRDEKRRDLKTCNVSSMLQQTELAHIDRCNYKLTLVAIALVFDPFPPKQNKNSFYGPFLGGFCTTADILYHCFNLEPSKYVHTDPH